MRIAISGANAGIGRRATESLARAGHDVVALCRDQARAEAAFAGLPPDVRSRITIVRLDLASRSSIRAASGRVAALGPLDALINNAAVFDQTMRVARRSEDGHELVWATNHLGPVELTARLSPALAASGAPRIVFAASKGIITMPRIEVRFDRLDGSGWYTPTRAYYHSKLAQIMTAMTIAEAVGDQVDVTCLRIPAVRLDAERLAVQPPLLRALYAPKNRAAMSPEDLAAVYARIVTGEPRRARDAAVYVDEELRPVMPPRSARDPEQRRRLWEVTQDSIGRPEWAWDGMSS